MYIFCKGCVQVLPLSGRGFYESGDECWMVMSTFCVFHRIDGMYQSLSGVKIHENHHGSDSIGISFPSFINPKYLPQPPFPLTFHKTTNPSQNPLHQTISPAQKDPHTNININPHTPPS